MTTSNSNGSLYYLEQSGIVEDLRALDEAILDRKKQLREMKQLICIPKVDI